MPLFGRESGRKRNLVIITAFLLLMGAASALRVAFRPAELPIASNLVVIALLNLNVIVLLLLLVLLFRNLIKLWFERRQRLIGSRFKAKLVLAFLALALTPSALIFIIASNFINRSIEGWFKPQVERPLDQALTVAQTYYHNVETLSLRHARQLARVIQRDGLLGDERRADLATWLVDQLEQLGLSAVTVWTRDAREVVHVTDPVLRDLPTRDINEHPFRRALAGHDVTTVRELPSGDLIEAIAPIWTSRAPDRQVAGVVVVSAHVPERLEAKVRGISQAFKEYKQLRLLQNPIKFVYILLFLLMTLIVLFSSTWFGLYLARGITDPVAQLAEGTREVAAGNLAYKVQARADDEIGILVDSFNRMTDDLAESKRRLEEAYLDLQDKHTELEERRRYTETVLEAVTTGVVSFDPLGRVTTINRAAARMFGLGEPAVVGRPVEDVFAGSDVRDVVNLVARTRRPRSGAAELELHLRRNRATLSLLASATPLRGPDGEYAGAVVVFDDLTELLTAQRLAAWREVAQRIAHEIKNPLTPIQLSAQRLRRRLLRPAADDAALVAECTGTIIQEVDALKRLVDEFSRFARMPAPVARPTDVRSVVESVVALYRESHPGLSLSTRHADPLPVIDVDPDHLKRAILNLVDNAVEAVTGGGEVTVETASLAEPDRVRLTVSDTGSGISAEHKEKLFVPYFSTKVNGMGLGLPIVYEIVNEHGGTIRVEDNDPRGTRFVVELPLARAAAPVEA
jgi:two-component system nitrogen regulation sensor histidine kinase NtrY